MDCRLEIGMVKSKEVIELLDAATDLLEDLESDLGTVIDTDIYNLEIWTSVQKFKRLEVAIERVKNGE